MDNTIQSTNFRGAFEINYRHALAGTKEKLEALVDKENAQIFNNYKNKEYKTMYILDDINDKDIAEFLANNKLLRFTYYTMLNPSFDFKGDSEKLVHYIRNNIRNPIYTIPQMLDFIKTREAETTKPIQEADTLNFVNTVLKNLGIEQFSGKIRIDKNGIIQILKNHNIGLLRMTPPDRSGYRCVYLRSNTIEINDIRCIADKNGDILRYFEPKEKDDFSRLFSKYVENYKPKHE